MKADIANILVGVKLPERQGSHVIGEVFASAPAPSTPLQEAIAKESTPPITPVASPETAPQNESAVRAVHTLKNDLQEVVKESKMSLVKAVSLEEDRRTKAEPMAISSVASKQRSSRTMMIAFVVVLMFIVGGGALWGVSLIMGQQAAPAQLSPDSSLLFAESTVLLPLDGQSPDDLKRIIQGARTSSGTLGSIERIIPTITATADDLPAGRAGDTSQKRPATFSEYMSAIGTHVPTELLRALGDDFFFGIHTVDKNAPVIVVPVTSYNRAFAGMLAWEDTINADLAPAFTPVPALTRDANGLPIKRNFQDLVMRNADVRALEDDSGQIQLYYSFPSQSILVIAESPYSFPEILSRLQASRQL